MIPRDRQSIRFKEVVTIKCHVRMYTCGMASHVVHTFRYKLRNEFFFSLYTQTQPFRLYHGKTGDT